MRFGSLLLISFYLVAYGHSFLLQNDEGQQYVKLEMDKSRGSRFEGSVRGIRPSASLVKRDNDYVEVEIHNAVTFYSLNMSIGTPPQYVTVLVDTGSSDLWVTGSNVQCGPDNNVDGPPLNCLAYGSFDSSASSSWKSNHSRFKIEYGDTTYASGVWGTDQLHFGDVNASGLSFAVANASNSTVGVLGIGLTANEVTTVGTNGYEYDNLPNVLKRDNVIAKSAYSLFINAPDAHKGNVLFGAVDHKKYEGNLQRLPLISGSQHSILRRKPTEFFITLNGLGVTTKNDQPVTLSTTKYPALLDSGTTFSYFPGDFASLVARSIGATWESRGGGYLVNCKNVINRNISLVYDFGGVQINSPLENYLLQTEDRSICSLAIVPSPSNYVILGDVFLTSAYVVYDLEELEIALAQAVHTEEENIEVIKSAIPGAQKAPGYSNTWTSVEPLKTGGDIFSNRPTSNSSIHTSTTASSGESKKNVAHGLVLPSKWAWSIPTFIMVSILSVVF